jgi:hypothetical protein
MGSVIALAAMKTAALASQETRAVVCRGPKYESKVDGTWMQASKPHVRTPSVIAQIEMTVTSARQPGEAKRISQPASDGGR